MKVIKLSKHGPMIYLGPNSVMVLSLKDIFNNSKLTDEIHNKVITKIKHGSIRTIHILVDKKDMRHLEWFISLIRYEINDFNKHVSIIVMMTDKSFMTPEFRKILRLNKIKYFGTKSWSAKNNSNTRYTMYLSHRIVDTIIEGKYEYSIPISIRTYISLRKQYNYDIESEI